MINALIFIVFYFAIISSVLGYGIYSRELLIKNFPVENYGFVGFLGIFALLIYSYISNLIISHGLIHNTVILFIGITLFFLSIYQRLLVPKKILSTYCFFLLIFVGIIIFKTHDDFPYYHFPYINLLTSNDIIIGIGNLNHGFRTPSSIFYLNSLFYLPYASYYLFSVGVALIMGFALEYLSRDIFDSIKKKNLGNIFFLRLLSIVFILVFFYRLSEHGTDRSAQILIFLLVIETIIFLRNKNYFNTFFPKLIILGSLIISLKNFYFVYLIILVPIFYHLYKNKRLAETKNLFLNKIFFSASIFLVSVLLINFLNSGCLVYPVSITCFENFIWSISLEEVKLMNDHYENWSKAGAGPNFRVENTENYIAGFNWVNNWLEMYFFNKMSDFLLGILFLITVIFIFFKSNKTINVKKNNHYFFYSILLLLLFEWFYNHPALRYGGYSLIALIIFIPFCNYMSKFKNDLKKIKKNVFTLILLASIIFLTRNLIRISDEIEKYQFNPLSNIFYKVDSHHLRIDEQILELKKEYDECKNSKKCEEKIVKIFKRNGKFIIYKKND